VGLRLITKFVSVITAPTSNRSVSHINNYARCTTANRNIIDCKGVAQVQQRISTAIQAPAINLATLKVRAAVVVT